MACIHERTAPALLERSSPARSVASVLPSSLTIADARGMFQAGAKQTIDLAQRLAEGKLRVVNREAAKILRSRDGVQLSEKEGNGIAWIEGTDFAEGTIEVDIRGRDVLQRSFVGIAFHRKDDQTFTPMK